MSDRTESNHQFNHRRSIRLKGYDYSLPGVYFITLLSYKHSEIFGNIINGQVELTSLGRIIYGEWFRSAKLRSEIRLFEDEFILMPNHLHGIVWIEQLCNNMSLPSNTIEKIPSGQEIVSNDQKILYRKPHSLSSFISGYKSSVTSLARKNLDVVEVWQRNYYDRIIRNEGELQRIWAYIDTNPQKWIEDKFHPSTFDYK